MGINSSEKRETSKGLLLVDHKKLGKCIVLVKEKSSGKYGLLGGGIEKWRHEGKKEALRRELEEEIGFKYVIEKIKELVRIETNKQIHNVFALKVGGEFTPAPNEIAGFAFYPLEDAYRLERKAIRKNMENYAIKVVNNFRWDHDWQSYDVSEPKIERKYFRQFRKELEALKNSI